nr:MAG TPA: hypothetical protein [Bacteriophage sp.]
MLRLSVPHVMNGVIGVVCHWSLLAEAIPKRVDSKYLEFREVCRDMRPREMVAPELRVVLFVCLLNYDHCAYGSCVLR